MAKFDFKSSDVGADSRARHVFHDISINGKTPYIDSAPATEANSGYQSAIIKSSRRSLRKLRRGNFTPEDARRARAEDRKLYPKFIAIHGWGLLGPKGEEPMVDSAGNAVEFNEENVGHFLQALPDWVFDDYRNYVGNPQTFVDARDEDLDELEPGEIEDLAGN